MQIPIHCLVHSYFYYVRHLDPLIMCILENKRVHKREKTKRKGNCSTKYSLLATELFPVLLPLDITSLSMLPL